MGIGEFFGQYDVLLAKRRVARERGDYDLADRMRMAAEWFEGQTIVDTREEVASGRGVLAAHDYQYFTPMRAVTWLKKYGEFVRFCVPGKEPVPVDGLIEAVNRIEGANSDHAGRLVPFFII